ncbi:hypothetical protein BSLA_02r3946 [Burkholderia stabilis]|nr:hypothetical protein BSLA_02r3946 [Burkholderia stabilis]
MRLGLKEQHACIADGMDAAKWHAFHGASPRSGLRFPRRTPTASRRARCPGSLRCASRHASAERASHRTRAKECFSGCIDVRDRTQ